MLNSGIWGLAEKMGRLYEAAGREDQEWFEGALQEFQTQMQRVKAAVSFVDQAERQSKAYRAAKLLFLEMPFVREESYNSLTRLPQDLQSGRFRTLYELLRDCRAETYDETMTNLVNDPRTAELLKSRAIEPE